MSVLLAEQTSLNQWLIRVEESIPQLHITNFFAFGYRRFWDETSSLSASFLWKWIESRSVMSHSLWPHETVQSMEFSRPKYLGIPVFTYTYIYLYILVSSSIILFLWDEAKVILPSEILKLSFWMYFFSLILSHSITVFPGIIS